VRQCLLPTRPSSATIPARRSPRLCRRRGWGLAPKSQSSEKYPERDIYRYGHRGRRQLGRLGFLTHIFVGKQSKSRADRQKLHSECKLAQVVVPSFLIVFQKIKDLHLFWMWPSSCFSRVQLKFETSRDGNAISQQHNHHSHHCRPII